MSYALDIYAITLLKTELNELNKAIGATDDANEIAELILKRKDIKSAIERLDQPEAKDLLITCIEKAFSIGFDQTGKTNLTQEELFAKVDTRRLIKGYRKVVWEAYRSGRIWRQ